VTNRNSCSCLHLLGTYLYICYTSELHTFPVLKCFGAVQPLSHQFCDAQDHHQSSFQQLPSSSPSITSSCANIKFLCSSPLQEQSTFQTNIWMWSLACNKMWQTAWKSDEKAVSGNYTKCKGLTLWNYILGYKHDNSALLGSNIIAAPGPAQNKGKTHNQAVWMLSFAVVQHLEDLKNSRHSQTVPSRRISHYQIIKWL